MGLTYSSVVRAEPDEVFAWHSRPGAITRLMPPWQPVRVAREAPSVRDGRAVLVLDDLLDIYLRAVTDPALTGPVNAVAPAPVRNAEYASTLGRVLRRPALIPVPPFGPQLLLGAEGAKELAAASQRVRPAALAAARHAFRYPHLEGGLRHVLGRDPSPAGPRPAPVWDTAASE